MYDNYVKQKKQKQKNNHNLYVITKIDDCPCLEKCFRILVFFTAIERNITSNRTEAQHEQLVYSNIQAVIFIPLFSFLF
jgi:hypothetical protein